MELIMYILIGLAVVILLTAAVFAAKYLMTIQDEEEMQAMEDENL